MKGPCVKGALCEGALCEGGTVRGGHCARGTLCVIVRGGERGHCVCGGGAIFVYYIRDIYYTLCKVNTSSLFCSSPAAKETFQ